jgi:hypothetical protein
MAGGVLWNNELEINQFKKSESPWATPTRQSISQGLSKTLRMPNPFPTILKGKTISGFHNAK